MNARSNDNLRLGRAAAAPVAMTRRLLRRLAGAVAGAVLLAQLSIAAYACPALMPAPQATPAVPASGAAMAEPPSGCDDMAGAMDSSSANLCAEHCKYGQQSGQAPTLDVPAAVLVALYATPRVSEAPPPPRPTAAMSALAAAWPPHAILHCVYRI